MTQVRSRHARGANSPMCLALACFAGVFAVSFVADLPSAGVVAGVFLIVLALRRRPIVAAFVLGATLATADAGLRIDGRLDAARAGLDLTVTTQVIDFVDQREVTRLWVRPLGRVDLPRRLRLSWYDPIAVPDYGQCWELTLRLRPPRGYLNAGRFDYERWLFEQNLGATGYVREGRRLDDCPRTGMFVRLRQRFFERLVAVLPHDDARAVLLATTLGARQWLTEEQWRAFSVTGTGHLMAISGLHIALAAGLFFGIARGVLAAVGSNKNHITFAGGIALCAAATYALVSGLAIPAKRSVLMLAIGLTTVFLRRRVDAWHTVGLTALLMLSVNPLDGFTVGFRLSFLAVVLLLVLASGQTVARDASEGHGVRLLQGALQLWKLQIVLLFGMLPLVITAFGRVAWTSPATNILAVPIFNLLTMPAALLGTLFDIGVGDWLLLIAWRSVKWSLGIIDKAADLPFAAIDVPRVAFPQAAALGLTALLAALPIGWPGRKVACLGFVFVVLHRPAGPPESCVDLHVLDVGQGLSTLVRTHSHALLYDAGPAFRSGNDTGKLVVAPYLRESGVEELDLLVISHGDNDHAGGAASVADAVSVVAILHGEAEIDEPLAGAAPASRCQAGQFWRWDEIRFTVLHPSRSAYPEGNNASCVIQISVGDRHVLLTGDIEAAAERALLSAGMLTSTTIALVPHHGSKTSSSAAFVESLSPSLAIVSAGYANRWGMPTSDVVDRWSGSGARVVNTADSGQIAVRLCADRSRDTFSRQRDDHRRFWHAR